MAAPSIWVKRIGKEMGDMMIVGHLPHLGKLASLLLSNTQEKNVIGFQQGVVCLEKNASWSICWIITPEFLAHRTICTANFNNVNYRCTDTEV